MKLKRFLFVALVVVLLLLGGNQFIVIKRIEYLTRANVPFFSLVLATSGGAFEPRQGFRLLTNKEYLASQLEVYKVSELRRDIGPSWLFHSIKGHDSIEDSAEVAVGSRGSGGWDMIFREDSAWIEVQLTQDI